MLEQLTRAGSPVEQVRGAVSQRSEATERAKVREHQAEEVAGRARYEGRADKSVVKHDEKKPIVTRLVEDIQLGEQAAYQLVERSRTGQAQ